MKKSSSSERALSNVWDIIESKPTLTKQLLPEKHHHLGVHEKLLLSEPPIPGLNQLKPVSRKIKEKSDEQQPSLILAKNQKALKKVSQHKEKLQNILEDLKNQTKFSHAKTLASSRVTKSDKSTTSLKKTVSVPPSSKPNTEPNLKKPVDIDSTKKKKKKKVVVGTKSDKSTPLVLSPRLNYPKSIDTKAIQEFSMQKMLSNTSLFSESAKDAHSEWFNNMVLLPLYDYK